jgi:lipoate-protein ligase A
MNPSDLPLTTWRLVKTLPAEGAWNMAVDEALLESIGVKESPPTLRLFAWSPACLSLGYAQPFSDVDLEQLNTHGWRVVRRITGGRAILHTDELTYAVIAPHDEPRLAGGVLESYQRLSQALLAALKLLGLPAEAHPESPARSQHPKDQQPVCFEVPSNYEITVRGKKLVGSAQARKKPGILQHGSLPLYGDLTRILEALTFPDEDQRTAAANRLMKRATTVEAELSHRIEWEQAANAFENAFADILNLRFQEIDLTPNELARVDALVASKYAHPDWLERI